jgi:hypothetical protein
MTDQDGCFNDQQIGLPQSHKGSKELKDKLYMVFRKGK